MRRAAALLAVLLALLPARAWAYVYWTEADLLASFFPAGTTVETVEWTPDAAARAGLEAALGYPLPHPAWTLRVGHAPDGTTSVAVLDQQRGQHEPIDFGVLIGPDGKVRRVEVLVYREAYGDGVRAEAFRRQFVGRDGADAMRPGREIRIVSGATISTRSIATGVRRACLLVEAWRRAVTT